MNQIFMSINKSNFQNQVMTSDKPVLLLKIPVQRFTSANQVYNLNNNTTGGSPYEYEVLYLPYLR